MELAEEDGHMGLLESVACALLRSNSSSSSLTRVRRAGNVSPANVGGSEAGRGDDIPTNGTSDRASSSSAAVRDAKAIDNDNYDKDGADVDVAMRIGPTADDSNEGVGDGGTSMAATANGVFKVSRLTMVGSDGGGGGRSQSALSRSTVSEGSPADAAAKLPLPLSTGGGNGQILKDQEKKEKERFILFISGLMK
jgi:hypothetical protein